MLYASHTVIAKLVIPGRIGVGSDPGEFAEPTGIAIDRENRIYIADSANKRVQVFDSNFRHLLSYWYDNKWQGEIFSPTDVAVDSGFYVFTVDFPIILFRNLNSCFKREYLKHGKRQPV